MGLAASQARFLNLTARKTNLEYEGQQINQQRTVLANQSANTYNQMLTLQVPTPPSETSFQTIVYNFTKNGNLCSISQVTGKDSKATILATETYVDNYVMREASLSPDYTGDLIDKKEDGKYYLGNSQLKKLNAIDVDTDVAAAAADIKKGLNDKLNPGQTKYEMKDIYYVNVSNNETPVYRYYLASQVETERQAGERASAIGYVSGSETKYKQVAITNAVVTRDVNNRIVNINDGESDYSVTATTVKDTVAYDDAYNEYEYQTYLYQQRMEQINAQTSAIQAQDKKLELRLKQLDTEQNAIKTEMESVSSVVKKNVEDTFKIFA